jgi:serine/threonine protein kinase
MQGRESGFSFAAGSDVTVAAVPRRKLAGAGSKHPHAGSHYDRYELILPIAEGGMGTVWLARMRGQHGFERMVALKALLPKFARDARYRNMFIDEARIASRIVHDNVAQVLDLGEKEGNLYLAMEWVNGDSLANLVRAAAAQGRVLPLPVILRIIADVCAGLHSAHELQDLRGQSLNLVHRDVSPQNILVTETGAVKVIDFGVVKARGRLGEDTNPGIVKGKLPYMAPERALGADVDRRADIWALGAIMYRILGGRSAYDADGNPALIWALVLRNQLDPLPNSVPPAIVRIVQKALARDLNDRYRTAAELQVELEKALHRISATTPTTGEDVAAFVTTVLGSTLAVRRAAIERALGSDEQTATLIFLRPLMTLVPSGAKDTPVNAPAIPASQRITLPPLRKLPAARTSRIVKKRPWAFTSSLSRSASSLLRTASLLVSRVPRRIRSLPAFVAACGLSALAIVLSSQPAPVATASVGRTAPSGRSAPPLPLRAPVSLAPLPEPTAVNVDDLALESVRVSLNPARESSGALWKDGFASHSPVMSSPAPSSPVLSSAAASKASSTKLEPKPVRSRALAAPVVVVLPAKPTDAPATLEKAAASSSPPSASCNPPYALDRNGRKKFRPECF